MELYLCSMTKELSRAYHRDFVQDPSLFADPSQFRPYIYSAAAADAHWERQNSLGRVHLAVMLGAEPIGDVVLKNRNAERRSCELGICMKNDSVKNRGYGTRAEILVLRYAFGTLGMETVFASALTQNIRSCHVLQKVGFRMIHRDETFCSYRCDKASWTPPEIEE